jgi:hypothetical protein
LRLLGERELEAVVEDLLGVAIGDRGAQERLHVLQIADEGGAHREAELVAVRAPVRFRRNCTAGRLSFRRDRRACFWFRRDCRACFWFRRDRRACLWSRRNLGRSIWLRQDRRGCSRFRRNQAGGAG